MAKKLDQIEKLNHQIKNSLPKNMKKFIFEVFNETISFSTESAKKHQFMTCYSSLQLIS